MVSPSLTEAVAQVDAILSRHHPTSAVERAATTATQQWLTHRADPFEHEHQRTHVTASAVVIDEEDHTHVLLHHHRRLRRWLQPGGHVDLNETVTQAAVREVLEETGVTAAHPDGVPQLIHVDDHPGPRGHRHLDLRFLLLASITAPLAPAAGESPAVKWVTVGHAARTADVSLAVALRSALRALEAEHPSKWAR